jgi:arylsulfatase A-like enzyme
MLPAKINDGCVSPIFIRSLVVAGSLCVSPVLHGGDEISKIRKDKPNIVFILCDDLGIGDLGVYGQKKLKTPNIDSIAKKGMTFTDHYSGSTVCAPSRCSLMTGMHMGHAFIRGNYLSGKGIPTYKIGQCPIPKDICTIPKVLKGAGYRTGMYGKWGLGGPENSGSSLNQGFDDFFGYYCQAHAHTYYPKYLWHNNEKIKLDGDTYSHNLIWNKGVEFITQNAKKHKPFFVYMAITIPHAAMSAPSNLHKKWQKKYPQFNKKAGYYCSKTAKDHKVINPVAGFAAMMENLDNQVGGLIKDLKKLGIYENTIIIFTSDNGTHKEGGHLPSFWDSNGPFRGFKRDLYEGGVRTPMLVSWPNVIKAGSTSNEISAFWDWLPTFADIVGEKLPEGRVFDGISLLPTLMGKSDLQKHHKYLYWEFKEGKPKKAVRSGKWKAVWFYKPDGKTIQDMELYDLSKDPGERHNVSKSYPEKMNELSRMRDKAHTDSPYFRF